MSISTNNLLLDKGNKPVPQFYNAGSDVFQALTGDSLGGSRYGSDSISWGKTTGGVYVPIQVDANGVVQTTLTGSIVTLDSTTVPLGASGTYATTTPFDITKFKSIVGSVFADQTGTLLVEQSWDGTNWDIQSSISVSASTAGSAGQGFDISVTGLKGRLSYTNGSTVQTVFRLYVGGKAL